MSSSNVSVKVRGTRANSDKHSDTRSDQEFMLPQHYIRATPHELAARITVSKQTLGERAVVLAHFYQHDTIIQHADFVGDSFQLSQAATTLRRANAIVFCGVHFMTETADILSRSDQTVILPNLTAGCSMADMANIDQVEHAWRELQSALTDDTTEKRAVIPVTYINSAAAIKDFCGRNDGIVCTSSNARTVLEWALARGHRVLFLPDQHLGRNTAKKLGIAAESMTTWEPDRALGGNSVAQLRESRILLWDGFCSVHQRFTVAQIAHARRQYPQVRVIVHPECPMEVVDAADLDGSTDFIVKTIQAAPAGSVFAIGTEINLVQRLAAQYPQHTIFSLDPRPCPCPTMARVTLGHLAWALDRLVDGETVNRIEVPSTIARGAQVALERMLAAQPS